GAGVTLRSRGTVRARSTGHGPVAWQTRRSGHGCEQLRTRSAVHGARISGGQRSATGFGRVGSASHRAGSITGDPGRYSGRGSPRPWLDPSRSQTRQPVSANGPRWLRAPEGHRLRHFEVLEQEVEIRDTRGVPPGVAPVHVAGTGLFGPVGGCADGRVVAGRRPLRTFDGARAVSGSYLAGNLLGRAEGRPPQ